VCSKNPGNFDEAFAEARREEENVLMSRRQGKNLEGGDAARTVDEERERVYRRRGRRQSTSSIRRET
jgi:hypothetical protein